MEIHEIVSAIEGILFASGEPVPVSRLTNILELDDGAVEYALRKLESHYNEGNRGIRLLRIEDSVQLCSAPEYAEVIRQILEKRRTPQLSPTALEVLAIVAYFQPVTRAYVESVRGVDSSYTVATLQSRGLIEPCGQLQVPGRPTLFQTTKAFLRAFGVTRLDELPILPEVEDDSEAHAQLKSAIEALQEEQATAEAQEELEIGAENGALDVPDVLGADGEPNSPGLLEPL
ncbi:MAG: SMC-Scp complex subunit ScpB [Oscillospiraceae bacterium]|nr:SMC-Scp complex subunit ScpB [Oscillospiraceae bacterium]